MRPFGVVGASSRGDAADADEPGVAPEANGVRDAVDAGDGMVRDAWYVAARSGELRRGAILGRTLLGTRVALFRDQAGAARALAATCPHRGGDLSRGRVEGGALECPLHGWRFDGGGRCIRIPSQAPALAIPERARTPSFIVKERDGLVWLWVGKGQTEPAEPPTFPFWSEGNVRRTIAPSIHVHAPFVHMMEQSVDDSHNAFVHRGALGVCQFAELPPRRVAVDADERGFRWEEAAVPGSPLPKEATSLPAWRRRLRARLFGISTPTSWHGRFDLGGVVHVRRVFPNGRWDVILAAVTPSDAESSWLFVETTRNAAKNALGEAMERRHLARLTHEDAAFAGAMPMKLARGFSTAISARADQPSLTFRRLYARWLDIERARGGDRDGAAG